MMSIVCSVVQQNNSNSNQQLQQKYVCMCIYIFEEGKKADVYTTMCTEVE